MDPVLPVQSPALGAAVAALGLSNKAVYAEDMQDSNGGVASGMEGGNYTDGPDMAPNAAPAAVAGQLARPGLVHLSCASSVTCTSISCAAEFIATAQQGGAPSTGQLNVKPAVCGT